MVEPPLPQYDQEFADSNADHKTWRRGVDARALHHVGRRGALENLIDILVWVVMIEND